MELTKFNVHNLTDAPPNLSRSAFQTFCQTLATCQS